MRKSPQSCRFGRKPGGFDTGQRFKVTYRDGMGKLCTFGYAETLSGATIFVQAIEKHPVFCKPSVIDRGAKSA